MLLRGRTCWLVALLALICLVKATDSRRIISGTMSTDFRSFYFAGLGVLGQGNIYDFEYLGTLAIRSGVTERIYPYLYPPPLAFYVSPLTKLGATGASRLWCLLSVILSVVMLMQSMRLAFTLQGAGERWKDSPLPFLALLLFLVLPFDNNLKMGQVNIIVLTCVVVSLVQALAFDHDLLAGFLLAPAVLMKVTPLFLLLFFLLNRRYRTLWGCVVGLVIFTAPTVMVSGGLQSWQHFFGFMGSMSYGKTVPGLFPAASLPNFSVAGCITRLAQSETTVTAVTSVLVLLLGVALLLQHRRLMRKGKGELLVLPYLIFMIIASPLTYLHHVVLIYPGLLITAWLIMPREKRGSYVLLALMLGLAFIASTDFPLLYNRLQINGGILSSVNLYALLILFILGLVLPKTRGVTWDECKSARPEEGAPADADGPRPHRHKTRN